MLETGDMVAGLHSEIDFLLVAIFCMIVLALYIYELFSGIRKQERLEAERQAHRLERHRLVSAGLIMRHALEHISANCEATKPPTEKEWFGNVHSLAAAQAYGIASASWKSARIARIALHCLDPDRQPHPDAYNAHETVAHEERNVAGNSS